MDKLKIIFDKFESTNNKIEKNIYITDLKYLFHNEFKEDIENIINKYKSKTIGDKRATEISKLISKLIDKKVNIPVIYRVPEDKWYGCYYDSKDNKYEMYRDISDNSLFVRVEKATDYYGNERINVNFSFKSLNITTLYYAKKENNYIYDLNEWEKLRYIEINDVSNLAQQIKDLYNNSIIKINELREEIKKQEKNINNDCIRGLTNNCIYIYGDYRDKLLD